MGTKTDLNSDRTIETTDASEFADDKGWAYYEVSSKTGDKVEDLFKGATVKVLEAVNENTLNLE